MQNLANDNRKATLCKNRRISQLARLKPFHTIPQKLTMPKIIIDCHASRLILRYSSSCSYISFIIARFCTIKAKCAKSSTIKRYFVLSICVLSFLSGIFSFFCNKICYLGQTNPRQVFPYPHT